jgi:hypothetical protein
MSIIDPVKKWMFGIALKKGVLSLAKLLFSYISAKGITIVGSMGGVAVDLSSELAIVATINTLLKVFFNWLKTTYPEKFGWL